VLDMDRERSAKGFGVGMLSALALGRADGVPDRKGPEAVWVGCFGAELRSKTSDALVGVLLRVVETTLSGGRGIETLKRMVSSASASASTPAYAS
jgi:hypothetical protein